MNGAPSDVRTQGGERRRIRVDSVDLESESARDRALPTLERQPRTAVPLERRPRVELRRETGLVPKLERESVVEPFASDGMRNDLAAHPLHAFAPSGPGQRTDIHGIDHSPETATSSALEVKPFLGEKGPRGGSPMRELRIGEVAERADVATSAIRYYESEGLIPAPPRRGGRRVYDESVVDRLGLIELAKRAGFTIAEIRELLAGFGRRTPPAQRWRALTSAKMAELEERIAEAQRMKAVLETVRRCACPTLADCGRAARRPRDRR